jgi:hypothetical protein
MKAFRKPKIAVIILWVVALIFLAVDIAGPILGSPPPTAKNGETISPTVTPSPVPTQAGKNGGKVEKKAETPGGGVLYPLTKNIPTLVNELYFYHLFFYPLPPLFTVLLFLHITKLGKAQKERQKEIAENSVTMFINAPVDDTTPFGKSSGLLSDLAQLLTSLPQNQLKARGQGYGLPISLGYISRVGANIQLVARLPFPNPKATLATPKNPNQKALKAIPNELPAEVINMINSRYDFCQMIIQPTGFDHLDLDSVKDSMFLQRRNGLMQKHSAYKLLTLEHPFMPIKTEFEDDPTTHFYSRLDLSNDSGITACGVEFVLVPAQTWATDLNHYLDQLKNQEVQQQFATRKGSSTKAGASPNTTLVARSKSAAQAIQTQTEVLQKKLEEAEGAFCVFAYLWAEGSPNSVTNRLKQLEAVFNRYSLALPGRKGKGNRFICIENGQSLDKVRLRAYPPLFGSEPSVLNTKELAGLWHLPNQKIKMGVEKAGAMSPPPALPLIHKITLPDGTSYLSDNKWRLVWGTYRQNDGTKLEVGLPEQGCYRGVDVTGLPGSGKSVDLEGIIIQTVNRNDTENIGKGGSPLPNNSFIAADPNGDFVYDTLDRMPPHMEDKIAIVDPLDPERVVGMNPMFIPQGISQEGIEALIGSIGQGLDDRAFQQEVKRLGAEGVAKDGLVGLVAASMIDIFAKTQGVSMENTPNVYRVVSNAIRLAVGADGSSTIWTLLRIINDAPYREAMVSRIREPLTIDYWLNEFPAFADKGGGAQLSSTRSRLENLLRSEPVRRLFTQRIRTLDIREFADKGYGVFFRFSPLLGEEQQSFLLATSFTMVKQAIFSRSDGDKAGRRMCHVLLDEFQQMVGADSKTLTLWLEQARKFGGAIVLSHQNLAQVKVLLEAMKGTLGSYVPMRVGSDDRSYYARFFDSPEFPAAQIERVFDKLPAYSKVVKLHDGTKQYPPILLNSLPRIDPYAAEPPKLVAIQDDSQLNGYRLELYNPTRHGDSLEPGMVDGVAAKWQATARGVQEGIKPVSVNLCAGLIEELTGFLHKKGQLAWGLHPFDLRGATLSGYDLETVRKLNRDTSELKKAQELLLEVEQMPKVEREDYLAGMEEKDWQLYRMSRKGRDTQLRSLLTQHKGIIPEKRSRVLTLSRLMVGTPVPEIEAEGKRSDSFTVEAEQIRERMMNEALAAEESGSKAKGKRKKSVTV